MTYTTHSYPSNFLPSTYTFDVKSEYVHNITPRPLSRYPADTNKSAEICFGTLCNHGSKTHSRGECKSVTPVDFSLATHMQLTKRFGGQLPALYVVYFVIVVLLLTHTGG